MTFNYDVSLEQSLYRSLTKTGFLEKSPQEVENFFKNDRFLHVYGQIRNKIPFESELKSFENRDSSKKNSGITAYSDFISTIKIIDEAYECSDKLKIIGETKADNQHILDKAKEKIRSAECVYILGYGFDRANSKLLSLTELGSQRDSWRKVLFTNYLDRNQVNKRAGEIFLNNSKKFLTGEPFLDDTTKTYRYYEKSIRDVYGALAMDFDSIEEKIVL